MSIFSYLHQLVLFKILDLPILIILLHLLLSLYVLSLINNSFSHTHYYACLSCYCTEKKVLSTKGVILFLI